MDERQPDVPDNLEDFFMAIGKHTHKRGLTASRTLGIMKDAVKEKLAAHQSNMAKDDIADHAAVADDLTQKHADAVCDEQEQAKADATQGKLPLAPKDDWSDDDGGGDAPPPQGPGQGPGGGGTQ